MITRCLLDIRNTMFVVRTRIVFFENKK